MYVWDANKALSNIEKHGIDFAETPPVLEDELTLTIEDPDEYEDRFVTIGMDAFGRILVVVYAYEEFGEEENIRIISARKANKREREHYEG